MYRKLIKLFSRFILLTIVGLTFSLDVYADDFVSAELINNNPEIIETVSDSWFLQFENSMTVRFSYTFYSGCASGRDYVF